MYYFILVALHTLYLVLRKTIKPIFFIVIFLQMKPWKADLLTLGPHGIKPYGFKLKYLVPTPMHPVSYHPIFTNKYLTQMKCSTNMIFFIIIKIVETF